MARYPRTEAALVRWAGEHAARWGNVAGIGLPGPLVASLAQKAAAAKLALERQREALQLARNRTTQKRAAFKAMKQDLTAAIATIDAHAAATGDASVYTRAAIDAPRRPRARPAPATPTGVRAGLIDRGAVEFAFEASTGGSAAFEVQRRTIGLDARAGPWGFVATVAAKRFVDADAPQGVAEVAYRCRVMLTNGKRSDWSEPAAVEFGVRPGVGAGAGTGVGPGAGPKAGEPASRGQGNGATSPPAAG